MDKRGPSKTSLGQTTRHVDSMAYAYGGVGESWGKQDEKDMAAATAQHSHVAFKEAYRLNQRGLRNEQQMAEAFGFNPDELSSHDKFIASLGKESEPTPGGISRGERIRMLMEANPKRGDSRSMRSLRRSMLDEAVKPY
jgi:hypothetical protein